MADLLDTAELLDRAAALVEAARSAGADAADAVAVKGGSLSIDVRLGKVEESERAEANDLGLRVFVGRRSAHVSANATSGFDELAARAVAMARVAPEDPYAGLADAADLAATWPDLDLLDRHVPVAAELIERALAAEDAARAVAGVTNSGGASASWSLGGLVLVTSTGFSGGYLASRHSLSVTAVAGSGTEMERDWESTSRIHRADLPAAAEIGRRAGERAVARLRPSKPTTGSGTVIWEPRAAISLVGHVAGAVNGAAVARKTSFLKDRLGERLFPAGVTIVDDPFRVRGLGSRPFDGEGLVGKPLSIVDDGILTSWLLDCAAARELGMAPNGRAGRGTGNPSPSSTNLTLLAGTVSQAEMIASVERGILVTDMIGAGVNGVTGDYSRGASGFWIENGQLGGPVSELTVAGNLIDMYARLVPANDLEYRFGINAPSLMVEGLTIAGR